MARDVQFLTGVNLAKGLAVSLLALLPVVHAEQTIVRYLDLPPDAQPHVIAADSGGNLFTGAIIYTASTRSQVRILKTGPDGRTLAAMDLDMGDITAATLTPKGTLVIAGSTSSADFPLISPVLPNAGPNAGVVVELDTQLEKIVFSTRVGGKTAAAPARSGSTYIQALATDSAGNLFITGSTLDTDFPVTPGAFQTTPPKPSGFGLGSASFAFVTEISADRKRLAVSTYFGDDAVTCIGGSHCIGVTAHTNGVGVGVDPAGNIVIAGTTTANHLPLTSGAYASECKCTSDLAAGFAASFSPDGSKLRWATYVPLGGANFMMLGVYSMAVDASGRVFLSGAAADGFATTAHAVEPNLPEGSNVTGFVAALDSAGQHMTAATYFGGGIDSAPVRALALDRNGQVWVTGGSDPAAVLLQSSPLRLGPTYVAALSEDLSTVRTQVTAPDGAAGVAIATTADGTVASLGAGNSVLAVKPGAGPSLLAVVNSAASRVSNVVATYELVSLYGIGIGPTSETQGQVVDGVLTNTLGGVQVLFDGTPAPLLYAGPNQINAIVPSVAANRDTVGIQVVTPTSSLEGPVMSVRPAQPAVFLISGSDGQAAALNQDGSLNSASNPAEPGSVVSIWATGAGVTWSAKPDGSIVSGNPGPVGAPVSVLLTGVSNPGTSLEVLYAGDAPGLAAGVVQINFRLPEHGIPEPGELQLQVGSALSPVFTVYIR